MRPHAFVAMPFGTKPGHDGQPIDFNRVYDELIAPALVQAGCDVFRADQEMRAGDIRSDMFQELLIADLVLADLTLDNPNVWYELGVRHALRARGVVLIQGPRGSQPFDIYTDRKLRYSITNGVPDPAAIDAERERLANMARETLEASSARKVSPVYTLLGHLREPQWRDLLLSENNEFSRSYEAWRRRLEVARQKNRPGDILVLAGETPTRALRLEARRAAGDCLIKLQHFDFALEQFDEAIALDDQDVAAHVQRGWCLARLGRFEDARAVVEHLARSPDGEAATCALAGRIALEQWVRRWHRERADESSMPSLRSAAAAEEAILRHAIEPYRKAFTLAPGDYHAGVQWLMLATVHVHLTARSDPETLDRVLGGVHWSCLSALQRKPHDYAARSSYATMCLLCFDTAKVQEAWASAVATADGDWFALESSWQMLAVLQEIEFRPEQTAVALAIVERELALASPPFQPGKVLLFSGHMVDAPTRPVPRFPMAKVPAAAERIDAALAALDVGPGDLALCQGAAGGDLMFLEACQARGVRCQLMLPLPEPAFLQRSVIGVQDGEQWRARYFVVKSALRDPIRVMPVELGPLPEGANPFERCNLWLLNTALAWGVDKVRFICLWNGAGSDGPGGTAHMYEEVGRRTGHVDWIDVREL